MSWETLRAHIALKHVSGNTESHIWLSKLWKCYHFEITWLLIQDDKNKIQDDSLFYFCTICELKNNDDVKWMNKVNMLIWIWLDLMAHKPL